MNPTAIKCVYCEKPLLDADHARAHVVNQCEASPSKKMADALVELVALDAFAGGIHTRDEWDEFDRRVAFAIPAARAALRAAGRLA